MEYPLHENVADPITYSSVLIESVLPTTGAYLVDDEIETYFVE